MKNLIIGALALVFLGMCLYAVSQLPQTVIITIGK
jgi:hypothetical protein